MVVACWPLERQRDILDAARIYKEAPEAFERVREMFPGPFTDARRIPAFDEADNRPKDIKFLKDLKRSIPAEIIQVYTWGEDGPDVIRVVVGAYGIAVSGSTVALVYFEDFPGESMVQQGVDVFDSCDAQALQALQQAGEIGHADVYCRINANWYAYQSVT